MRELTGGRGVQAVVDTVGGDRFLDSLRSLAIGGRLAVVGFTGGSIPELKVNRLLLRNLTVLGVEMVAMDKEFPGTVAMVNAAIEQAAAEGRIKTLVGATFGARRGRGGAAGARAPRGDRQGRRGGAAMRAVVVAALDGPDGLALQDFPEPEGAHPLAGDDRLLIEVHAAGVAFPDLLQSRGEYQFAVPPPFVTGGEASGVVVEAPDGSGFAPGDRVAGMTVWGAMAEYALAIPRYTVKLPDAMSFVEGAALWLNYSTALVRDRARRRASRARPCSSTAPPAASAPRRSTCCAGWARARSRSCPATRRSASRASWGRPRWCARPATGWPRCAA